MKRLIKNNEFFNGYQGIKAYYECFKNPTSKEWNEIISNNNFIRGIIHKDGTVYLWNGDLLHNEALNSFGIKDGIHFDSNSKNYMHIYINKFVDPEYFQEAFENSDTLYNYFSKITSIEVNTSYYSVQRYNIYEVATIQNILDFNMNKIHEIQEVDDFDDEEICWECHNYISECICDWK